MILSLFGTGIFHLYIGMAGVHITSVYQLHIHGDICVCPFKEPLLALSFSGFSGFSGLTGFTGAMTRSETNRNMILLKNVFWSMKTLTL